MESTAILIDITSCKKIMDYLEHDPAIEAIIDIRDQALGYMGDLFVEDSPIEGNEEIVKNLIEEGKITIHFHAHTCRIPADNSVHCIRLEPYYLVKDF